ncbi:MAG TPA: nuclear transport factor 2 family protein [Chthoniobacterales bacterium]|nr:nuclear transport factor 2 family protein [Chthoniobacterales bacterium]
MPAVRVALTGSFLGLFGFAGLFANYGAPPGASSDLKKTEDRLNMSNSISTLLTRNLNDVFGENDPARRRKAIDEIFTEDAVFYDPMGGVFRGRDEIDGIAGKLRTMHPDFQYQPIGKPEEVGNGGRVRWTEGRPGEKPEVGGTDFIVARDGRIAAIYLFFDKLP